jgi:hypothetical protein
MEPCALGSTQPLKMSTKILLGVKTPVRNGDNLTTFIVLKVEKIRSLNLPEPLRPPRPVAGHLIEVVSISLKGDFVK